MADYESAYKALMAKRAQEMEAAQMPTEQAYTGANNQQQLGTLLNALFKSQALMGSVGGKPTQETGVDMTSFGNSDLAALDSKTKRATKLQEQADKNFQAGRQGLGDLMGNEKFGMDMKSDQQKFDFNQNANPLKLQDMQQDVDFNAAANPLKLQGMSLNNQGQAQQNNFASQANPLKLQGMRNDNTMDNYKLQDAQADRTYSPEASRVREQLLQAQKQQLIAQGGNPTSIDQELATLGKAQKIYETAQSIESTDPKKAAELRQKLDSVISPNKARRLEDLESPIYKSMKQENKAPTDGQTAAALYGTRAEEAASQMDALAAPKIDANGKKKPGYDAAGLGTIITTSSLFPNMFKSTENQQQDQAQRNFINATLRRESGASISPTEFESAAKQYFPQAGDSKEVLAQKKQNRQSTIAGLKAAAGNNALNNIQSQKGTSAPMAAPAAAATPSKDDAIAELRRRGLIK